MVDTWKNNAAAVGIAKIVRLRLNAATGRIHNNMP